MEAIKNLTLSQLEEEIRRGARFIIFEYTHSYILITRRNYSEVCFIKSGEMYLKQAFPYILSTSVLGWWGLPWGPIYTIGSLFTNFSGGKDVTVSIMESFRGSYHKETESKTKKIHIENNDYKHIYFSLLKKYHPDLASSELDKLTRTEITKKIIQAYSDKNYSFLEALK